MNHKEIIAKGYTLNKIFLIGIFTAVPYFMFCKLNEELFSWEKFNPDGIFTLVFLVLSFIGILSWLSLFDNNPLLIINEDGIWIRKSILPFSSLKYINWNQVKFIELDTVKNKNTTTTVLVIHRNDISKTKTIELDNIDYDMEEIISAIRKYSNLINYRDRSKIDKFK